MHTDTRTSALLSILAFLRRIRSVLMGFAVLNPKAVPHVLVLNLETAVHSEAFVEKRQHTVRKAARQHLELASNLMEANLLALAGAVVLLAVLS